MLTWERSPQSPDSLKQSRSELQTLRDCFVRNAAMYHLPGDTPFRDTTQSATGKEVAGDLDRYFKGRDIPSSPEDIPYYQVLQQTPGNIRSALLGIEALIETGHIGSVTETQSGVQKISTLVGFGISSCSESLLSTSVFLEPSERAEAFRRVIAEHALPLFSFVAQRLPTCAPEDAESIRVSLNHYIQQIVSAHAITIPEGAMILPLWPFLDPSIGQALLQDLHDLVVFEFKRGRLNRTHREFVYALPEPYRGQLLELFASAPITERDSARHAHDTALQSRHRLYNDMPDHFRASPFAKDGSALTVFGEGFENQVITRDIDTLAFLGWRKAFEASEAWKSLGFSHVPVEPIIRALPGKDIGTMHVRARVLRGITVQHWFTLRETLFENEIRTQQAKIREGLRVIGVEFAQEHQGHDHDQNYIVVPERDDHGQPRFDVPPRVYLIDFDQAAPLIVPIAAK